MKYYTRIETREQITKLKGITLHDEFKFFFSLFFDGVNHSQEHLLQIGKSVLFTQDGIIHSGNFDGITSDFVQLRYDDFIKLIARVKKTEEMEMIECPFQDKNTWVCHAIKCKFNKYHTLTSMRTEKHGESSVKCMVPTEVKS